MAPKSSDPTRVDEMVQRSTAISKQTAGFRSCTTSVDALMGPGAKDGDFVRVVVVEFEDALGAPQSEDFEEFKTASEQLGPSHYRFEYREL